MGEEGQLPASLLVGVTGSVSVLGLPQYLQKFRAASSPRITVIMTASAARLLPVSTMSLYADVVCTDTDQGPGHVALARSARQFLVLPATAHLLSCVAAGSAPNLLCTAILAAEPPVVIVPSMNPAMWYNRAVQRNVAQIRADGHVVVDPVPGTAFEVASRTFREGPVVPSPDQVIDELVKARERKLGGHDHSP